MKKIISLCMLLVVVTTIYAQQQAIEEGLKQAKDELGRYVAHPNKWEVNDCEKWFKKHIEYKLLEIKSEKIEKFGAVKKMVVRVYFILAKDAIDYERTKELASVGLSSDYTFLFKGGCIGNSAYLAYRFVNNTTIEFKKSACGAVDYDYDIVDKGSWGLFGKTIYHGISGGTNNLAEFYNTIQQSPTCFETGKIPVRTNSGEIKNIPIPQNILDARTSLYQKAASGTIHDLFQYENTYKSIDRNTKVLQSRKHKMLYTSEFFDDQSEAYKKDLYVKMYRKVLKYQARKDFITTYTQYDPLKYRETMNNEIPMNILDRLIEFEKYYWDDNSGQNKFVKKESYGLWGLGSRRVINYYLYNEIMESIQNAIAECTQILEKAGQAPYQQHVSKVLNSLQARLKGMGVELNEAEVYVAEIRRTANEIQQEKCNKCVIDYAKTKFPANGNYGTIYMKNGESYKFDMSSKGKYQLLDGFFGIGRTEYSSFNELVSAFEKECIKQHCE
jgi:hypothetical protein